MSSVYFQHVIDLLRSPAALLVALLLIVVSGLSSLTTIKSGFLALYQLYRSTLGYKRSLIRDLNQLSVGVNLDYFQQILGSPVFVNSLPENHSEHIFVSKHVYVQAITDSLNTVQLFSVTTRNYHFKPVLNIQRFNPTFCLSSSVQIVLGKTKFVDLDVSGKPRSLASNLGAAQFSYYEEHSFGSAGNFNSFFFSVNPAGCDPWHGFYRIDTLLYHPIVKNGWSDIRDPQVADFRKEALINTYTIRASLPNDVRFLRFGPTYQQVRCLGLPTHRRWSFIERRRIRKLIEIGPYEYFKLAEQERVNRFGPSRSLPFPPG